MSSLTFTLRSVAVRVSPDPHPFTASQLAAFSMLNGAPRPSAVRDFPPGCGPNAAETEATSAAPCSRAAVSLRAEAAAPPAFSMLGGAPRPSAVRDFPPGCGCLSIEAEATAPPAAAGDEIPTSSKLESDDNRDAEFTDDDISDDYEASSPERDYADEYEEDLMSCQPEIEDAGEYYYDDMSATDEYDEYEEDLMSTIAASDEEDDDEEDVMATAENDEGVPEEVIAEFLKTATVVGKEWAAAAEGGVCAVCLDDLYEEEGGIKVIGCGHGFHGDCIGDWLRKKNDCPLCRATVIQIM